MVVVVAGRVVVVAGRVVVVAGATVVAAARVVVVAPRAVVVVAPTLVLDVVDDEASVGATAGPVPVPPMWNVTSIVLDSTSMLACDGGMVSGAVPATT